ncbi:MAG TPA: GIY-YIG nuclease family protein [Candidatus Cloacimonadota bacterium]|nr:GIY-YIG nuclease family protein [Candidatus Cloacimonadota bacterium]
MIMSFFNGLKNAISKVAEDERKRQTKQSTSHVSALPPGRMKETDTIKGKDCEIPNTPGAYRHINKETGEVDYVGQTDNLRKRQQEHERNGKLDTKSQTVACKEAKADASKDDLCNTERDHIKRHNPSGNKTKGGNGRR